MEREDVEREDVGRELEADTMEETDGSIIDGSEADIFKRTFTGSTKVDMLFLIRLSFDFALSPYFI